jgi:hypothetical protein
MEAEGQSLRDAISRLATRAGIPAYVERASRLPVGLAESVELIMGRQRE